MYVESTAADEGNGQANRPFGSIGTAIDALAQSSCRTIEVGPGSYTESLDFGTLDVILRGRSGPAETRIVSTSQHALRIAGAQSPQSRVSGFTFSGMGIAISGGAQPVITQNIFRDATSP